MDSEIEFTFFDEQDRELTAIAYVDGGDVGSYLTPQVDACVMDIKFFNGNDIVEISLADYKRAEEQALQEWSDQALNEACDRADYLRDCARDDAWERGME